MYKVEVMRLLLTTLVVFEKDIEADVKADTSGNYQRLLLCILQV